MDKMRLPMAKVLVHSRGLGAPDPGTVRERAEELAQINGHEEYTAADWEQAKLELHGAHLPDGELTDEMAAPRMFSEADRTCVDVGHHASRVRPEDDRNLIEELWQEGMEEAEHERMLEATRALRRRDEEE